MPREEEAPDFTKQRPATVSIDDALETLPDYEREDITNMVQKLLVGSLKGDIKLPTHQQKYLEILGKKYIENAATAKEEIDPIDFQELLSAAYQNNLDAFNNLQNRAAEFFTLEKERDKSLSVVIGEVAEEEVASQHTPEGLNDNPGSNAQNAPHGANLPTPEDNRFDEMELFSGDGVLPTQAPVWVPHLSGQGS